MRHEEIYHTCDRCGKRIDKMPIDTKYVNCLWKKIFSPKEYKLLTADREGYITSTELISEDVVSATIFENYELKEKKFDLCGDCRKAFERFMRNEKD